MTLIAAEARISQLLAQSNESRTCFLDDLRSVVHKALQENYMMRPLQSEFTLPSWLFTELFGAWKTFEPERRLPNTFTYKTPLAEQQLRDMLDTSFSKLLPVPLPGSASTSLVVTWQQFFIAFRQPDHHLWITFSYKPDPEPRNFVPNRVRRGRSTGVAQLKLSWTPAF